MFKVDKRHYVIRQLQIQYRAFYFLKYQDQVLDLQAKYEISLKQSYCERSSAGTDESPRD